MPMPAKAFTTSMASAGTFSSSIDLGYGWNKICLAIPTMVSGSDICIQASDAIGGTYRRIYHAPTTASGAAAYQIASGITNCIVPIQVGVQFVRVEVTTATTDNAYTFKFICVE